MRKFTTVLIANRGEIACRVMRTASRLGFRTVAVHSDVDHRAPHVRMADASIEIGPASAAQSYLNIERIIAAAHETSADAIHPGYGFLSENAEFARRCAEEGIVFIGPDPRSIDLMGNKAAAKRLMIDAGVPCVPGYQGEDQSDETLIREAKAVGFPLMIKAAAGGGGKGMRLVHSADQLEAALLAARSEARNAFGSGELILERAIIKPRHVEIQVFGDTLGNIIHMGERDCSVQRRHQKVLEESPSPVMTPQLRRRMGEAAVAAARTVDYHGAGTVEFLLGADGEFYFLEMNTRLQVEHPVTEAVTGLDLVELQLRVAEGLPLGISQEDIALKGHAIEARLYAEDAANDFLPATGRVDIWASPAGEGVRCDAGLESGVEVSPHYDPMLAKIVGIGPDRETARLRLVRALKDAVIFGPKTNRAFLIGALERPAFIDGQVTTGFIAEEFGDGFAEPEPAATEIAIAAVLLYGAQRKAARDRSLGMSDELLDWSSGAPLVTSYLLAGKKASITPMGNGYRVVVDDETIIVADVSASDCRASVRIDGTRSKAHFVTDESGIKVALGDREFDLRDGYSEAVAGQSAGGDGMIEAPMHGLVLEILVGPGQHVEAGQRLAVMEAMKMQHDIVASEAGEVSQVLCEVGRQVVSGALLFELATSSDSEATP